MNRQGSTELHVHIYGHLIYDKVRNINDLRYADDTTLMAESEELKSLLMKVKKESEKFVLKLNIQKTNLMTFSPISSVQSLSCV